MERRSARNCAAYSCLQEALVLSAADGCGGVTSKRSAKSGPHNRSLSHAARNRLQHPLRAHNSALPPTNDRIQCSTTSGTRSKRGTPNTGIGCAAVIAEEEEGRRWEALALRAAAAVAVVEREDREARGRGAEAEAGAEDEEEAGVIALLRRCTAEEEAAVR